MDEIRLDKWMWAARLFKTRSQASDACRSGKVAVAGHAAKPSRLVRPGDEVEISETPIVRRFRVLALGAKRVSPLLARELVEEITPADELERLRRYRLDPRVLGVGVRVKGSGRPTKRERRQTDRFFGGRS